jgi:hypothetical protein
MFRASVHRIKLRPLCPFPALVICAVLLIIKLRRIKYEIIPGRFKSLPLEKNTRLLLKQGMKNHN